MSSGSGLPTAKSMATFTFSASVSRISASSPSVKIPLLKIRVKTFRKGQVLKVFLLVTLVVSFFTDDVDAWFGRVQAQGLELRTPEITDESGRVRVFVAYDREGYFLEWDTFLDVPGNEALIAALGSD